MYNLLNIKEIATKKNITLKDLIKRAGVTEAGFYRSLENNSMNIKTVAKIAEILKVSISDLVAEKTDNEPLRKSIVESPIEIYEPPTELVGCYKVMLEQQKEIAEITKEKSQWVERCLMAEKELEIVKNANAPVKDALAG